MTMTMRLSKKEANHACPRRSESIFVPIKPGTDTYEKGRGLVSQKRGCSYCGSMHPDDFMEAVRSGLEIGPTDKSYKFYVNDHEGKFYTQHLSEEQGWEFHRLWQEDWIKWGYPGHPYVRLYIPGPSTRPKQEGEQDGHEDRR